MSTSARRKEGRLSGERIGEIKLSFFKRIQCGVSDLSTSGAKLDTDPGTTLPETFDLTISGNGKPRKHKCKKRWQEGNTTGVEFLFD